MKFSILSNQIIKPRSYCPNPVVRFGVPSYADAKANPKVVNTLAYQQWWEEQLYYIHNGYTTGGITIPGRYYKFVNFDPAQTAKGVGPMELHDYQLDFALWVDHLKSPGVRANAYVPKARRKAMSVMTVGMVVDYGWRFGTNYHAAVVAGLDEYSQDFISKWKFINMHMAKELRVKTLRINDDEIVAGWKEQTEEGWVDAGTQNTIYIRTVNNNPNVLKGKFLNDIVYEESGENELLLETIAASEDCLKVGNVQYGSAFIYGTGGNMSTGSKGFKEIHLKLGVYNCQQFYIPAYVFLEPAYAGAVNELGEIVEDIPNLQHLKPYQRVGWSDFERGKELIELRKKALLAEGDMEKYIKFCQNNPINIEEIFRRSSANNFDMLKLNEQLYKVESEPKQYNRWHLSYKKNPKTGEQMIPSEVEILPATNDHPEHECVYILNDGHPIKGYKYLDVAGCLLPGEQVLTEQGLLSVEDVTKANKLINEHGKYVHINELLRHEVINESIFKITVSNTLRTTTFTSEHPILISKSILKDDNTIDRLNLKFNYIKVPEIEIGDWIKVPNIYRNENEFDISSLWDNYTYHPSEKINSPLYESDFWWVIGLWLGDGWCESDGRKISFAINTKELEYADRLVTVVKRLFKRKINIRQRQNSCIEMCFCNEQLNRFLCKNFGKYAIKKRLPEWAKRINVECKKQLILGYLDSDGCIAIDKKRNLYNTQFVSINLNLLEGIQDILFALGHVSQICKLRNAFQGYMFGRDVISDIKECYQLRLGHSDTINLVKDLWWTNDPKLNRIDLNIIRNTRKRKRAADGCFIDESLEYIYFKVRKIEISSYSGFVYNFNCDTHTYMCHHITTHNCDSYDQNQAKASKSLGSMVVFRRQHTIPGYPAWCPVALIRNRPKYKEQFYELCIKLAVYYDLNQSVLVDIGAGMIIKHFQDTGNARFLSSRPRKFESPNTQQTHDYGVSLNSYSKPKMVSALQTLFDHHVHKIHFEHILSEALNYDEFEIGSDNDAVDALGIALMKAIDEDTVVMDEDEINKGNPYDYPEYERNGDGDVIPKATHDLDSEPLGKDEDYVSRLHRQMTIVNKSLSENNPEYDPFDD